MVAEKADGRSIEVGVYGRDGMGPGTVLLGSDQTPHHQYMQIAGTGFKLATTDFLKVVDSSPYDSKSDVALHPCLHDADGTVSARERQFHHRRATSEMGADVPRPLGHGRVSNHS